MQQQPQIDVPYLKLHTQFLTLTYTWKKKTGIVLFMLICSSQLFLVVHTHNIIEHINYYRHTVDKIQYLIHIFGGIFPNNDHKVSQSGQVTCIHYKNTKLISIHTRFSNQHWRSVINSFYITMTMTLTLEMSVTWLGLSGRATESLFSLRLRSCIGYVMLLVDGRRCRSYEQLFGILKAQRLWKFNPQPVKIKN